VIFFPSRLQCDFLRAFIFLLFLITLSSFSKSKEISFVDSSDTAETIDEQRNNVNDCTVTQSECVVLLHGLARTKKSMRSIEKHLKGCGYHVEKIGDPSRKKRVTTLAKEAVNLGVERCQAYDFEKIHFIGHSLGSILVRYYLEENQIDRLGRVVMLAPPNQGSEVVDRLRKVPGFKLINGLAGYQLGTKQDKSIPKQLGAAKFDVGVIAGNRTINLILSQFLPNPDDGKVSVSSTCLKGMSDHLVLPYSHPFIIKRRKTFNQVTYFLTHGKFYRENSDYDDSIDSDGRYDLSCDQSFYK